MHQSSGDQYVYRTDHALLALGVLLVLPAAILLYIFDVAHVGIIITNPLAYFVLGSIFFITKRAYIQSNSRVYFVLDGAPARSLGGITMIFGLISFGVFNYAENIFLIQPSSIVFGQSVIYVVMMILVSLTFGNKLIRQ